MHDEALVSQRGAQEIVFRGQCLERLEMAQKAYLGIPFPGFRTFSLFFSPAKQVMPLGQEEFAVSYTHLTLPTIYSV